MLAEPWIVGLVRRALEIRLGVFLLVCSNLLIVSNAILCDEVDAITFSEGCITLLAIPAAHVVIGDDVPPSVEEPIEHRDG